MSTEHLRIDRFTYEPREGRGSYEVATVDAGAPEVTRVVPPAGESHAFTVRRHPIRVQVSVSPTGRSVQVWINGVKLDL